MTPLTADVTIVGSGAAGAVMAARLAERGARVVVLEEGPRLAAASLDGQVLKSVRALYRSGGAMLALGLPPVTLAVGCVVGGSTVINGGTCFRAPPDVLAQWSDVVGGAFKPRDLDPYFDEVERDLSVGEVPPELAFAGERRVLMAARARGDEAGFVKRNVSHCQGTGLCAFGCPTGAKQSMELSYIPRAEAKGARVIARARALRIVLKGRRAVGVYARDLEAGRDLMVESERVVLAAGALHTPLILRRSLGGRTPRATGRHLHLHPGLHVVGIFAEPVAPRKGPIQSVYVDSVEHDYMIFGMGLPPELVATLLMAGPDLAPLAVFPHTVTLAVMASDHDANGQVRAFAGMPLPFYGLTARTSASLTRGAAHAAELLFAAGAVSVRVSIRGLGALRSPAAVASFAKAPPPARTFLVGSVHPMGTCRMGLDPRNSVVGPDHRVHGIDGLYVPDASFFPTSLGVNPQITINAFALRAADQMLANR